MWPISKCKSQKFMTHKLKIITNPYFLHLMLCTFQHLCQKEAMWTMFWRPRQKRTFITFLWSWHSGSKCANKFVCYSADNKKMEKYLLNRKSYILWLVVVEQYIVYINILKGKKHRWCLKNLGCKQWLHVTWKASINDFFGNNDK